MATQALRSTPALEIKVVFKLQDDFLEDADKITCHGIWCRRHISHKQVIPSPHPSPEGRSKGALALTYSSKDDGWNSFPTAERFVYYSPQACKKKGSSKAGTNLKKITYCGPEQGFRWSAAGMHCYWETWKQAELDVLLQHINNWPEELAIPNNSSWNVIQTAWKYLK